MEHSGLVEAHWPCCHLLVWPWPGPHVQHLARVGLWATLPDPSCRDCAGLHLPSTSAQGCPMSLHAADTDPVLLNMFYSWPGSWAMPGLC